MSQSISDQVPLSISYSAVITVPLANIKLGIRDNEQALIGIDFLPSSHPSLSPVSAVAKETSLQLQAYFADPQFHFDLPLETAGTPFQQRVWQALCHIAAGQPLSYGDLARQLQSSARAIGGACRRNPVPVVVPCHRVVGKQGLGGFGGATCGERVMIKQCLLQHEANV